MRTKSLPLLSMILAIFLMTYSAKAQNNAPETDSAGYKTFNFYFINGYAISYDMIKHDRKVFRIHLDFAGTLTKLNGDESTVSTYNPNQSSVRDRESHSYSVSLSFYYIYSFYKSDLGEIYAGLGPGFGFNKTSYSENTTYDAGQTPTSYDSETKHYSVGLTFVLGLKSYITKNVNVFAELQTSGGKLWEKSEWTYTTGSVSNNSYSNESTKSDLDGWFYNTQFIRMGISVSL